LGKIRNAHSDAQHAGKANLKHHPFDTFSAVQIGTVQAGLVLRNPLESLATQRAACPPSADLHPCRGCTTGCVGLDLSSKALEEAADAAYQPTLCHRLGVHAEAQALVGQERISSDRYTHTYIINVTPVAMSMAPPVLMCRLTKQHPTCVTQGHILTCDAVGGWPTDMTTSFSVKCISHAAHRAGSWAGHHAGPALVAHAGQACWACGINIIGCSCLSNCHWLKADTTFDSLLQAAQPQPKGPELCCIIRWWQEQRGPATGKQHPSRSAGPLTTPLNQHAHKWDRGSHTHAQEEVHTIAEVVHRTTVDGVRRC
jgi:hypothetical protein